MKKLLLVFVFLAGVLSAKDVPLRVKFQTSDKYPSIEITSLYDGIITIDHAKIVANNVKISHGRIQYSSSGTKRIRHCRRSK